MKEYAMDWSRLRDVSVIDIRDRSLAYSFIYVEIARREGHEPAKHPGVNNQRAMFWPTLMAEKWSTFLFI